MPAQATSLTQEQPWNASLAHGPTTDSAHFNSSIWMVWLRRVSPATNRLGDPGRGANWTNFTNSRMECDGALGIQASSQFDNDRRMGGIALCAGNEDATTNHLPCADPRLKRNGGVQEISVWTSRLTMASTCPGTLTSLLRLSAQKGLCHRWNPFPLNTKGRARAQAS